MRALANGRLATASAVAACCLLTLLAKLAVNAPRTGVNHGDVSFYVTVARNLAEGRGFVIDYIWNFWNHPEGFPSPSNDWWMPLPSALCALGMLVGGVGYAAAQASMIVVTSLLPLLVYLLGRDLFGESRTGLVGALLAATFHLFMDQPCAPLSHGPYLVLAATSLWLIVRAAKEPRWLLAAGAAIGLTQLCRSDGILLLPCLAVAFLAQGRRPTVRQAASVAAGYAAALAPWWVHNLVTRGVLMPGGSLRAAWMRHYEQWYALPESVTPATWLADGWAAALRPKLAVGLNNLDAFARGLVTGAVDRDTQAPALLAVLVLAWIGLLFTFRRRFLPCWTLAALQWAFYSLLFTAVGNESFRTSMFSLYPWLLLCAAHGLLKLGDGLGRLAPWLPLGFTLAVCAWLVPAHFLYAQDALVGKAGAIDRVHSFYETLRTQVFPRFGLQDAVVMAREAHELHALTGVRCVMIPFEDEPTIRAVAQRYGVTHLMLLGESAEPELRPSLRGLAKNPHWEAVLPPTRLKGQGPLVQIWRLRDT